jgi:hypothetical protein
MKQPTMKQLRAAPFILALLFVEAVPVYAWLLVYAAAEMNSLQATAAPFWLVCAILALFALSRRWFRQKHVAIYMFAVAVAGVIAFLALARFSPLMYGAAQYPLNSVSWLVALSHGNFDSDAFSGLVFLVAYLGWRGVAVGAPAPPYAVMARRIWITLGATILALFGALAAGSGRDSLTGTLILLLALEGVAGLSALALSRPASGLLRNDARMPGAESSARWQALSFIIAIAVVLLAVLIGGALDTQAVTVTWSVLGSVGFAVSQAVFWLGQGLVYLLELIFSPLASLFGIHKQQNQGQIVPPHGQTLPHKQQHLIVLPPFIHYLVLTVIILMAVALLLVILFAIARAIANARARSPEEVDEEREALDAQSLLAQQFRALLDRLRAPRPAPEHDDLQRGSARWLYRELMRAGARAGVTRQASETADEYAVRLAGALRVTTRDDAALPALAQAYDTARYGSLTDDPPATPQLAAQTQAALANIRALPNRPQA